MKTYLQKRGCALVPVDDEEADAIRKLPDNVVFRAELKRPRNLGNHKHMMRILNYVLDNSDRFRNMDALLLELKIRVGHYEEFIRKTGEVVFVPKSINFDSMPEDDFQAFKKKAIDVILDDFLPGVSTADRDAHFMNLWRMAS